jgi:nucleoside-diphosphate-sugar epimerase
VFPPIIYGRGEGPGNQHSVQIPSLVSAIIQRGKGITVGEGESRWGNIHIKDVSKIFTSLVEKATSHSDEEGIWGEQGIYLTGVGEEVTVLST